MSASNARNAFLRVFGRPTPSEIDALHSPDTMSEINGFWYVRLPNGDHFECDDSGTVRPIG